MKGENMEEDEIRKKMLHLAESGESYEEALKLSADCAESESKNLRINALHCFGYIARVYKKLDMDVALPLLRKAGVDPDIMVSAAARDALDDIEVFLPESKIRTEPRSLV